MLSPPDYTTSTGFATGISSLVDIQVHTDGSLYYLARGGGEVFRVQFTAQHGAQHLLAAGERHGGGRASPPASRVAASGTAPLQYQWQRNGVNIAGANVADVHVHDHRRRQRRDVPRGRQQRRRFRRPATRRR